MKYHVYIQRGMSGRGEQVSRPGGYHRLETARATTRYWANKERAERAHLSSASMRAIGGTYIVREHNDGRRTVVNQYDKS